MPPYREKPGAVERRFWAKVEKLSGDGCWMWTGAKAHFGYGSVRIRGKTLRAHRVSWEWAHGPIPNGLCVLHRCDTPACVRPSHLFLGTKAQNTQDMMRKGRGQYTTRRGESSGAAKLTWDLVCEMRRIYSEENGAFGKGGKGGITQKELGRRFGVSQALVGMIVRREIWKTKD